MELVVRKADLLRELQLFQGIVERKNTIPILANVLIEADGDQVKLLATDLEVGLRSRCQASVSKKRIADASGEEALRDHQGASRNGRADRGRQERRQGRGRPIRLAHADAAARGFSDAARRHRHRTRATLPRDVLKQMVAKTQFAITGEDTRYFLNGALFIQRPDSMSLVSTDGHRLALITRAARQGARASRRRRRGAGHPAAQDLAGTRPAALGGRRRHPVRARREPPVLRGRRAAADLAHDRRPVPGLRAGHPERATTNASSSIAIG